MQYITKGMLNNVSLNEKQTFIKKASGGKSGVPLDTKFDIFLSHSYSDKKYIENLYALLNGWGYKVYVDWIVDQELDRGEVTPKTAKKLQIRMNHSTYLLYATSSASGHSRWMQWELGYFDGRSSGKAAILPIVEYSWDDFNGLEFLGLYSKAKVEKGNIFIIDSHEFIKLNKIKENLLYHMAP